MKFLVKFILGVLFLPLVITADIIRSERGFAAKAGYFFLIWLLLGFTWIIGYRNISDAGELVLYELGISDKLTKIDVVGTSMMPTIKSGDKVTLHSPKKYNLARGDIVSFKNIETGNRHYLKRIIGLPGEEISIINGVIFIDNKALQEPYVLNNVPTYGNTFIIDCEVHPIPPEKVAVFGDNRTVSTDSRVLGFIDIKDIDGVIKTKISPRLSSQPLQSGLPTIDLNSGIFLEKLNQKREEYERKPLVAKQLLDQIATERAKTISANLDKWKQQSLPTDQLLDQMGYKYLLVQEVVTFGVLDEQQLVDQVIESLLYRDAFLSDRFYEIGIGTTTVTKGQCQFPLISIILSWPANPDYSEQDISKWRRDIDVLTRILTTLKALQDQPLIDQSQTQELINELTPLLETSNQFSLRVENNEWLTPEEYQKMEKYLKDSEIAIKKVQAFQQTYMQQVLDPKTRELLFQLLPRESEFDKKAAETRLLFGQGKYDEQLESARQLIEMAQIDQEKAVGHYWAGLALYKQGKPKDAEDNLKLSSQLNENYSAPYVTLAAISFDKQQYQQGLQYALKCVELDPSYAWCHNNLGLAYLYMGEKSKGIAELEKAVSLDPTSYVFNDNLKRAKQSR